MTTYHFHVEITDEFIWTVEDIELAMVATFYEVIGARGIGVVVRPYDKDHPSLRNYPHGHLTNPLTVQEGSSNVGDEREVA